MSKNICFVGLSNLQAMPFLQKYLKLNNNDYDVIYWDRKGIDEHCGATNSYVLKYKTKPNASQFKKLIGYIKFKRFAKSILIKNDYDAVVLLSGNVGVLLRRILLSKYKGKYIIDIRDYYKESESWYYNAEKKVVDNSALAVVSSKAFTKFLPPHDYTVVHNTQEISAEIIEKFRKVESKSVNEAIVISCIGGIRFFEQFRKVISYFKNDPRYILRFIGYGADVLKSYCDENNVENVILHDRFPPDQTLDFYYDTDIILNLYGNNTPLLDYALSNKLYYAAQLGKPILVCKDTYMEEVAVLNGFGFTVDLENREDLDNLYNYYHEINWIEFYKKCDAFLDEVYYEEKLFEEKVSSFFKISES